MSLVFLAAKEREALEFPGLKDPKVQWDPWAPLAFQENLELANLVPLATQESLENLAPQEEMAVPAQWACKDQRVTQGLQASVHQENQVRMVVQDCLDLWDLKVHKVMLDNQEHLACQDLENQVNLESQVTEESLVLQEPLVRKASQVQLVSLVHLVPLELLVQPVPRGQEDSQVNSALWDQRVMLAWLAHPD